MPTHQGKTQTDIVIGDGGDSAAVPPGAARITMRGGSISPEQLRGTGAASDNLVALAMSTAAAMNVRSTGVLIIEARRDRNGKLRVETHRPVVKVKPPG